MPSGVRLIMNKLSHVFTQRKAESEWRNKIIIRYKTKGQILQSVTIKKEYALQSVKKIWQG